MIYPSRQFVDQSLGAVLTHRNLVSASVSNLHGIVFNNDGLLLSYLPLAHIYEVTVESP